MNIHRTTDMSKDFRNWKKLKGKRHRIVEPPEKPLKSKSFKDFLQDALKRWYA